MEDVTESKTEPESESNSKVKLPGPTHPPTVTPAKPSGIVNDLDVIVTVPAPPAPIPFKLYWFTFVSYLDLKTLSLKIL